MKLKRHSLVFASLSVILGGCNLLYETPELDVANESAKLVAEPAPVVVRPLDEAALVLLNSVPYEQYVVDGSNLGGAGTLRPASAAIRFAPPPTSRPSPYRIGIGDVLELTRLRETEPNFLGAPASLGGASSASGGSAGSSSRVGGSPDPSVISTQSVVSEEGTVSFIETGPVLVAGKPVAAAREVVLNALLRNGFDARVQLQVSNFNAHKIFLNVAGAGSSAVVEPATTVPLTLLELLVKANISPQPGQEMKVLIQRGSNSYELSLSKVFDKEAPSYFLEGGDKVTVEPLIFRPARAFIFGAVDRPQIVPLSPLRRETLADALFVPGGVLSSGRARPSEIYLLRGRNPATAFHLDASNPARIKLAARAELRPDDVVFVSERPLTSWNRVISLLGPSLTLPSTFNSVAAELEAVAQ